MDGCSRSPQQGEVTITHVVPVVKAKRTGEISWQEAAVSSQLGNRDQLQTYEKASATLAMKTEQRLIVRENTLVVIGELLRDSTQRSTTGTVEIRNGRVQLNTPDDAQYRVDIAYRTPNAVAHAVKLAATLPRDQAILVNLSGRGDKDMETVLAQTDATGGQS